MANLAAAPAIPAPHTAAATWTAASVSSTSATTSATVFGATDGRVAVRKDMAIGFAAQFEAFVLERTYRFPVLAHWSFTATNEGDFQSLCQALDVGLIGTEIGTVLGPGPRGRLGHGGRTPEHAPARRSAPPAAARGDRDRPRRAAADDPPRRRGLGLVPGAAGAVAH